MSYPEPRYLGDTGEAYFEGLARIAATGERPSEEEMAAFYAEHDNVWVDR